MKTKNYLFGIIVSFVLAGLLAFLGLVAVTADNLGWGMVALLSYAVMFGGPLAIVLLLTWIAYLVRDRGNVPGHVHALLFAPTLLAVLIVPVSESIQQGRSDRFRQANPAIAETHVNLSGGPIGLDLRDASASSGASRSLQPTTGARADFSNFRRYPGPDTLAAGTFPYDGDRLKENATRYAYFNADGTPSGASLPLRRLPYPDIAKLASAYAYGEAGLLMHQYFHYADHVDVAPGLARFAGTTQDAMTAARIPGLTIFSLENYTPQTLVRLEINGQTQDLGYAVRSLAGMPCDPPRGGTPALLDLDQPVTLRWQTVEDAPQWHEATAWVPAFGAASKTDPDKGLPRVRLYLLPDGTVAAERFREVRVQGDLALRTTGVPEQARAYTACGGAYANYNPRTVKLLAP